MLCIEGRVALASFTVFSLLSFYQVKILSGDYWSYKYSVVVLISAFTCIIFLPYSGIMKRAAMLGTVFGASVTLTFVLPPPWNIFSLYFVFLTFFHFSEYMMTAVYNESRLSLDSFLLNHSFEYQLAAVLSWTEFIVEAYFFPSVKSIIILNMIGFLLVVFGESLRKLAMTTAKSNFSHIVQSEKSNTHQLVTSGIYSWTRHPSYVGWFYWSVGTQILLINPVCLIGYTLASWNFFNERVRDEEYHLIQFFGDDYVDYMLKVPTRLPFIHGLQDLVDPKKDN